MEETKSELDSQLVDLEDLEECARHARTPRRARSYRFRVNQERYTTTDYTIKGRAVLALADCDPPESFDLFLKRPGEPPRRVSLDETIDLREKGIEKFFTVKREQTEGEAEPAPPWPLPPEDVEFLARWEGAVSYHTDGKKRWVVFDPFPLPSGYLPTRLKAAIQITKDYPRTKLDMIWFDQEVHRSDGKPIRKVKVQSVLGARWQRWSRHYPWQNDYRIETHLERMIQALHEGLEK